MEPIASQTICDFLDSLASKTPAPGGGASACVGGALACAQAQMVIEYSIAKESLADHQQMLAEARDRLRNAREILLRLGDDDASAYSMLSDLQRLDPSDARRQRDLPAARLLCTDIPMHALATCEDAARIIAQLHGRSNKHLASDLDISALLLAAAGRACVRNVEVNLGGLDPADAGSHGAHCREMESRLLQSLADAFPDR